MGQVILDGKGQPEDNGSGAGGSSENPELFGTPSVHDLEVGGTGIP